MRNCPRCLNTAVIEDGYCGHCRECTMPSVTHPKTVTGDNMPTDLPATIAEIERLRAEVAELRGVLRDLKQPDLNQRFDLSLAHLSARIDNALKK